MNNEQEHNSKQCNGSSLVSFLPHLHLVNFKSLKITHSYLPESLRSRLLNSASVLILLMGIAVLKCVHQISNKKELWTPGALQRFSRLFTNLIKSQVSVFLFNLLLLFCQEEGRISSLLSHHCILAVSSHRPIAALMRAFSFATMRCIDAYLV